jgi:hypothetical protein
LCAPARPSRYRNQNEHRLRLYDPCHLSGRIVIESTSLFPAHSFS